MKVAFRLFEFIFPNLDMPDPTSISAGEEPKYVTAAVSLTYSKDPNRRACTAIYFEGKILPTCPYQVPTRLYFFSISL